MGNFLIQHLVTLTGQSVSAEQNGRRQQKAFGFERRRRFAKKIRVTSFLRLVRVPPPSRCKQNFLAGCCCNKKLQKSKKAEKVNDQRKLLLLLLLLLLLVQTFKALKQLIIHRFGITIMDHVGRRRYWNESCTASINI